MAVQEETTRPEAGEWAWHVHHDTLVERLVYSLEERILHIVKFKPPEEQELRLRLLRVVKVELPVELIALDKTFEEAREDARKYSRDDRPPELLRAYMDAKAAYNHFLGGPEMVALHAKECPDCPWDEETIFPRAGPTSSPFPRRVN